MVVVVAGLMLGGTLAPAQAQRAADRRVAFQGAPNDVDGYPMHRNYTPDDYGTQFLSQNWSVTQDDNGIIYVANPGGVLSYDGATWRVIPTQRQTLVRTLVSDAEGRVFVGAYGEFGYLRPDSTGTQRFVSLVDHIDPALRDFGHTWSSAATSDGVYFQTRNTLFRWDRQQVKTWTTSNATRYYKVFSVRDTVFVSQEGIGLRKIVDGQLTDVPGGDRFADSNVTVVLPHGRSGLLVGTVRSDLYLRQDSQFVRFTTPASPFFKENEVHDAVRLPDGSYAFATLWGGVIITDADGTPKRMLDETAGLIDDDVKSLYVDRQHGLWMACEKGLARTEVLQPLSAYDERAGLDGVAQALVRHDGTLHVGTTTGVFRLQPLRTDDGTVRPAFERVPSLRGQIFGLVSTPVGLLAATDRGVFSIRGSRAERIGESRATFGLHRSRVNPDRVYVGYVDGIGILRRSGTRWSFQERIPGLDKGVFFLEEDALGNLYAASAYSGLWWIQNPTGSSEERRIHELAAEGETPQHVFRMAYLPDGSGLRIVTRTGVAEPVMTVQPDGRRLPELVADTTVTAALPDVRGPVLDLKAAPDGDRWVLTPTATYWVRDTTAGVTVTTPFAPVPDFDVYAALAEAQGAFWVAGEDGALRHVPRPDVQSSTPVRTLIRRVLVSERDSLLYGGQLQQASETAGVDPAARSRPSARAETRGAESGSALGMIPRLAYANNSVRIEYAAPGYGHEESVAYRYRLEGFETEWSSWTPETRKEYTNLPPGAYTFTVQAQHPQLWTAEPATFAFRVGAPWYRTSWAYLLYGVLGVGIVGGLVRWRTAHLDRRQQWLEHVVTQRTSEVKEQARQLEGYNDELLRSNEELQTAVEEKSKLLGVAAHDLKNPLFGIRALSEVLLEQADLSKNVNRKVDMIRNSADETLRLINNLLASAASTAQAQMTMETVDLADLAEWVAHGFHPQADRKNQTMYCSVPSTPCLVEGDRRKIREVMNNLISNALKYSPPGAPIYVEVDRSQSEVFFHVHDEGPGLSEDDQQRMFAPFQRLTPSPTGDEGSSGLGLYIVRKIVGLHQGRITVDSELGEGSTFTMILPAVSGPPEAGSTPRPSERSDRPAPNDWDANGDQEASAGQAPNRDDPAAETLAASRSSASDPSASGDSASNGSPSNGSPSSGSPRDDDAAASVSSTRRKTV